ncbi:uncharacterized protein N7459_008312 [Penicillium hispanicum]|uniref:uncharacterized protein n=1 Tax=Penicillium hispanicum TaxID=1080232 RepID=UPI00253F9D5E|nr:uncharacterized protein N7459_008312 [Penicillium hispanicum]KAJ5573885.1 hypothetical protein N7459_008312 [Penicillium hispanicum]
MALLLSSLGIATALVVAFCLVRWTSNSSQAQPQRQIPVKPNPVVEKLLAALPEIVLLPHDSDAFRKSINTYWAQQEREVVQAAIVQPRNAGDLAKVIAILKAEYNTRSTKPRQNFEDVLFAIRGGGQSPISGSASAKGGVLIDLALFREVTVADDRESVAVGAGNRWIDVYRVLDGKGLTVVGGRSADVGVAGLTLGGGMSYLTPRFGLACSNVLAYEVVLASGEIITATATSYPDLWRALKGGSNNFGIVTRFILRCFPSTDIWSGCIYAPGSQSTKALVALHESIKRADPKSSRTDVDLHAAGPIVCFGYVQSLGVQVIAIYLAYTTLPEEPHQWPVYWKRSKFASLWRFWSSLKTSNLTSAVKSMSDAAPPGRRWSFSTTTIKNDLPTMMAAYAAHQDIITALRSVKGLIFSLVMQPLLPSWAGKGDANPLGIHESTDDALIIISFSAHWRRVEDDKKVHASMREIVEQIEAVATKNGTSHPYRYLNYCSKWQRPLEGYGEQNLHFLKEVSKSYDPDGLFQRGCEGGFKLDAHP